MQLLRRSHSPPRKQRLSKRKGSLSLSGKASLSQWKTAGMCIMPATWALLLFLFKLDRNIANIHFDSKKRPASQSDMRLQQPTKIKVAIVTSLTACPDQGRSRQLLLDMAAVLEHSIHVMSSQSKYDYDIVSLVHMGAAKCVDDLRRISYRVLIRDTPIDLDMIQNQVYRKEMVKSGCCGEKEFLKLYAYTLHEYPVVIHLDMDMIVLKPYDNLIDTFLADDRESKTIHEAMWPKDRERTSRVDVAFTRDYTMGMPGMPIERFNVQGGLIIVRPNQTTFEELQQLVLRGNYSDGWFDRSVHYPKLYGSKTIQGLLAFYYGHYHPEQVLELDSCLHNQMAVPPKDAKGRCFAVANSSTGECSRNCQLMNVADIHSIHFTNCGKPNFFSWDASALSKSRLCLDFHEEWFRLRHSLEAGLGLPSGVSAKGDRNFGHCNFNATEDSARYQPINWTLAEQLSIER